MNTQPSTQSPPPTTTSSQILDELIAEHGATLRRQALRHAPSPEAAEEAFQEACVQFLRAYEGPPGLAALRWMQTTTKRCAWAVGRTQRRDLGFADGVEEGLADHVVRDPAVLVERDEQRRQRVARIERLKPDERTALIMVGLGCSYKEVGERRGWTYTKVNRCVSEGRAALRRSRPD